MEPPEWRLAFIGRSATRAQAHAWRCAERAGKALPARGRRAETRAATRRANYERDRGRRVGAASSGLSGQ